MLKIKPLLRAQRYQHSLTMGLFHYFFAVSFSHLFSGRKHNGAGPRIGKSQNGTVSDRNKLLKMALTLA
jgi:hypothetical protein